MEIVICRDAMDAASRAADEVEALFKDKPHATLGLPTGTTPLPMYAELVRRHNEGKISLANASTFNLDEYIGLPEGHPGSYAAYMKLHLIDKTDLRISHAFLPAGRAEDLEAAAKDYERRIKEAGGIDLQILGIGLNGHIGFNEPGSSLKSRTRVKTLSKATLAANIKDFEGIEPPTMALTMGIGTILEAKRILLIATGPSKADAVRDMAEGPLSANCPASALQMHEKATIFVDEEAAKRLKNREYYQRSQALQEKLKNG
jgi:glucosamine-6-phosphate deaminase